MDRDITAPCTAALGTAAPRRCRGYSLLEVLIVLAIIGVVFSLGVGLADLLERERRAQAVLDLRRALNYARSQAALLQTTVTLCAVDGSDQCQSNWAGRDYAVFVDANDNRQVEDGETLLRSHWSANRGGLVWRASGRRRYVRFRPQGDTVDLGSFFYCPRGAGTATRVVVNRGGRNRVEDESEQACPLEE